MTINEDICTFYYYAPRYGSQTSWAMTVHTLWLSRCPRRITPPCGNGISSPTVLTVGLERLTPNTTGKVMFCRPDLFGNCPRKAGLEHFTFRKQLGMGLAPAVTATTRIVGPHWVHSGLSLYL